MTAMIEGQCMCAAVTVRARQTKDFMTACSCDDCRRWTGGVNFTFNVDETTAEITGPVKTISIQPWAERGFCGDCGSGIFYRVVAEGPNHGLLKLSAGLFPDAGGLPLGEEYYVDQRPPQFDLSRPHTEMTAGDVRALMSGN